MNVSSRLFQRLSGLFVLLAIVFMSTGCQTARTAGKVIVTPVTVVRDVVDAPLVTVTTTFEYFADQTRVARAPHVGIGWSPHTGIQPNIGYDLSHLAFKAVSLTIGSIDYIICRSLYPNWAGGITPWRPKTHSWGDMYFPNTRALWGDERPVEGSRSGKRGRGSPPGS